VVTVQEETNKMSSGDYSTVKPKVIQLQSDNGIQVCTYSTLTYFYKCHFQTHT